MTKFELLKRNKDFFDLLINIGCVNKAQSNGMLIYEYYIKIKEFEKSKMLIYSMVAEKFNLQERQVINIIADFEQKV